MLTTELVLILTLYGLLYSPENGGTGLEANLSLLQGKWKLLFCHS